MGQLRLIIYLSRVSVSSVCLIVGLLVGGNRVFEKVVLHVLSKLENETVKLCDNFVEFLQILGSDEVKLL